MRTKQLLDFAAPNRDKSLTVVPSQDEVRIYASSLYDSEGPLVSVVLRNYIGGVHSGVRISRSDALGLYHALGDYLMATTPNREEI